MLDRSRRLRWRWMLSSLLRGLLQLRQTCEVVVDTCLVGTWPVEALNLVAVEVQPNIPRLMVIRSEPDVYY